MFAVSEALRSPSRLLNMFNCRHTSAQVDRPIQASRVKGRVELAGWCVCVWRTTSHQVSVAGANKLVFLIGPRVLFLSLSLGLMLSLSC